MSTVSSTIKLGTFSYLPPMSREQVVAQVDYALGRGWTCGIEHVEPARATETFWYMWRLPLFGELNPTAVMEELDRCRDANPGHYVRLVAYDRIRQTQGLAFVVHRPE